MTRTKYSDLIRTDDSSDSDRESVLSEEEWFDEDVTTLVEDTMWSVLVDEEQPAYTLEMETTFPRMMVPFPITDQATIPKWVPRWRFL